MSRVESVILRVFKYVYACIRICIHMFVLKKLSVNFILVVTPSIGTLLLFLPETQGGKELSLP